MRKMPTRSSVRITSAASQSRVTPEPEPAVEKFYKIIRLSTIKAKMMKVPERFVRLGPKLSDSVSVETPVGFKRSIRIKRIGDEVWFENGWSAFAEAHSLKEGHFLLFHYKGNSSFRVVIFDGTTSEIEYPLEYVIVSDDDTEEVVEVMDNDDEQGLAGFESSDSEGVISLSEFLKKKKKPSVSIKSEKFASF
ncbi:B3 domain-containing protein At1g49475 isoform X2 [Capsella rubella]|nr:B3 domain-containing protein At1g49475 isoform X2 [Capsella rubella]